MAHSTFAELIKDHDVNVVNDLANDNGVRQSRQDLATNPKVTAALDRASGEIDAALLTGGRYSVADLSGLTGNALAHLRGICNDLAMARMFRRRPGLNPELAKEYRELAREHLKALRSGMEIFDLPAQQTASNPTIDGPSVVDYERLNQLPERMSRYMPHVGDRLPTDRT